MQDGCAGCQRLERVGDGFEHFVVNRDGLCGGVRVCLGGRGDGGDGVAVIEHLVAGEQVVVEPLSAEAEVRPVRKVGGGDDRQHTRHGFGGGRVDGADACVGVGTPHDLAVQHSRHGVVGAEIGAPRDFLQTIRANRPCADVLQTLCDAHAPSLVPWPFNYTMDNVARVPRS